MKTLFLIIVALCLMAPSVALASYSCAGGNCSVTCDGTSDNADFESAIAGVSDGGTITVGAGTCNFSDEVNASTGGKAFTLVGAGIGQTTINRTGTVISFDDLIYNKTVRISGFTINVTGNVNGAIYLELASQSTLSGPHGGLK